MCIPDEIKETGLRTQTNAGHCGDGQSSQDDEENRKISGRQNQR